MSHFRSRGLTDNNDALLVQSWLVAAGAKGRNPIDTNAVATADELQLLSIATAV